MLPYRTGMRIPLLELIVSRESRVSNLAWGMPQWCPTELLYRVTSPYGGLGCNIRDLFRASVAQLPSFYVEEETSVCVGITASLL